MNRQRFSGIISVIALGLLCNGALFGMKANNGSFVVNNKKTTDKASYEENELKRAFVSVPLFIAKEKNANEKKIHKMAIVNSWKQNIPMVNALRIYLRDDIVTIPHFTECDTHGTYIKVFAKEFSVDYPGQLNKKYITDEIDLSLAIKSEVDVAMHCAVLSNDTAAIKKLTPTIKHLYCKTDGYGRSTVQDTLLNLAIKQGNTEVFECIAQHDPYDVKNYIDISFYITYLDFLNNVGFRGTTQEEIDKYGDLYKKHGGKTYEELNPSCIIS